MSKSFNWKIFFILWGMSIFGLIAVIPYTLALQSNVLNNLELPMPLPVLLAIQITWNALMFGVLTAAGLFFANRVDLGTPILEAKLNGEPVGDKVRAILPLSILSGVIGSLIILGLEFYVFQPALMRELGDSAAALNLQTTPPAAWMGFLASFYGGIVEEILLRLFVMSLFVWLGRFIGKTSDGRPTNTVYWIANILAAVLFGLGHLPATAMLVPLTPLVVARAITLNGLLGIVFGWLYWKYGLGSAMLSHFSADIVLHVITAL